MNLKKFRIYSNVIALAVSLLGSGQVFATNYGNRTNISGAADFTDGTKWSTVACGGPAVGGTITPAAADFFAICAGTTLTLAASDVISFGMLAFDTTAIWAGSVLKFSSGNKTIYNINPSLAPISLNVSSMASGNTISIIAAPVTFSSVTGGSLTCGGLAYIPNTPIPANTTCSVTVAPVAAPIGFSLDEKLVVYSKEVQK